MDVNTINKTNYIVSQLAPMQRAGEVGGTEQRQEGVNPINAEAPDAGQVGAELNELQTLAKDMAKPLQGIQNKLGDLATQQTLSIIIQGRITVIQKQIKDAEQNLSSVKNDKNNQFDKLKVDFDETVKELSEALFNLSVLVPTICQTIHNYENYGGIIDRVHKVLAIAQNYKLNTLMNDSSNLILAFRKEGINHLKTLISPGLINVDENINDFEDIVYNHIIQRYNKQNLCNNLIPLACFCGLPAITEFCWNQVRPGVVAHQNTVDCFKKHLHAKEFDKIKQIFDQFESSPEQPSCNPLLQTVVAALYYKAIWEQSREQQTPNLKKSNNIALLKDLIDKNNNYKKIFIGNI